MTLYKSLVIPVLEYCSVLWCPTSTGLVQKLESIQWSFLRKIKGSCKKDYWECLKNMNIYSLERRRERYRIIYVWKVLENLVPNINGKIKENQTVRRGRHCTTPTVTGSGRVANILRSSFTVHGVQLFNAMPQHVRDATNVPVASFKKILDRYLSNVPDEPLIPGYTARKQAETNSLLHMSKLAKSAVVPISLQGQQSRRGEQMNLQA